MTIKINFKANVRVPHLPNSPGAITRLEVTENEMRANRRAFRIINVPSRFENDTKNKVLQFILELTTLDINPLFIINCEFVPNRVETHDVVVVFANTDARNYVFEALKAANPRRLREIAGAEICVIDELGNERFLILAEALEDYGKENVRVIDGGVHVFEEASETVYRFSTLSQYKKFRSDRGFTAIPEEAA